MRDTVDDLRALRTALRMLKADLAEADGDLDAAARHDWPPNTRIVTQELTLRSQLELVLWSAERLVEQGCVAARPLLNRTRAVLDTTGFTAPMLIEPGQVESSHRRENHVEPPERIVVPPKAVNAAMERLGYTRAPDDALLSKQPPHDPDLAKDWRLVRWWLDQL